MPIQTGAKGATIAGVSYPPYFYLDWLTPDLEALAVQGGDAVVVPSRSLSRGGVTLLPGSANSAANMAIVQASLDATGVALINEPGVYLFDTSAKPILIPDNGSLYKGPGVVLKVADGSPSSLITNHTARLPPVATVAGASVSYGTAPDGQNFCAVVSGLTPAQLAFFPVGSFVSAVVLGHGALGVAGSARNNRGYRGVKRVVANDGISVLKYEIDLSYPGSAPAQAPVSLYRVTRNPRVWGAGEIDGNGLNSDPAFNTGDPRAVVVWWHHAANPIVEGGSWLKGRTWTLGSNYVLNNVVQDARPRLREGAVTPPSCDFIHLCGQQDNTLIIGNAGDSGDNFVGFTQDCTEGTPYNFPYQFPGDMPNVRVVRTKGHAISDHGQVGIVALYGPAAYQYGKILIQDLGGSGSSAVQLSNYAPTNQNNLCIDSLVCENVDALCGGSTVEVTAGSFTLGDVSLTDVYGNREDVPTLKVVPTAVGTLRSLSMRRVGLRPYNSATLTRSVPIATFGGLNYEALSIDGCEGVLLGANVKAFLADGTGNIAKIGISNCSANGTGTAGLWGDTGAGTAALPVYLNSRYNGAVL